MKISYIIIIFLFITTVRLQAQQLDTLATTPLPDSIPLADSTVVSDSVKVKKGIFSFFTKDYPSPKKAAYLSLAFPGGGQIYNKSWWKLPLVYGAIGGMVYAIDYNSGLHQRFKKAYAQKLKMQPVTDEELVLLSTSSLRLLRDRYDKNTQLSYIGLVVVYALQSVEAFVDAHLKSFDVNEDLSLQLKPSFQTDVLAGQPTLGIGVALRFE